MCAVSNSRRVILIEGCLALFLQFHCLVLKATPRLTCITNHIWLLHAMLRVHSASVYER